MKRVVGLSIIAFCAALGAMVGYKMSAEAMAVVAGVVLGVLASIPMAILVLIVVRRSLQQTASPPQQPQQNYPPVIVVGQQPQQLQPPQSDRSAVDGRWRPAEDTPRFRMLGEDQAEGW